ncbi:MAG: hypothetical protein ABIS36_19700 [Chryseolinea sp.]
MAYKPSEQDLMAYLYDEMEGEEKNAIEKYLLENATARIELDKLKSLRGMMGQVKDKEVIAPPIFVGEHQQPFYRAPYFKTIISIAASLLVVMLVGKFSGLQIGYHDQELKISFGETKAQPVQSATVQNMLSEQEVQKMINNSLAQNNQVMQSSWTETQKKLDASVVWNLTVSSSKIDKLVKESSQASQNQIREFVSGMQTENMRLVKNYFQLNSSEQKQYIEGLLVDFSKYLQQQRNDDLQVVQTQLKSLENNTDLFKQETEQILTSIITTVGTSKSVGARN